MKKNVFNPALMRSNNTASSTKKCCIVFLLIILGNCCLAQDKPNLGLFGLIGVDVKLGITPAWFASSTGTYTYRLNQDATVKENINNKNGAALSMVILLPVVKFEKHGDFDVLFNIAFKDLKGVAADDNGFFNSQTPFGLGIAWFPFPNAKFLGITGLINFGHVNRMPANATDSNPNDKIFFPIADHKDSNLTLGGIVPDQLLSPYFDSIATYSYSAGITIRF